MNIDEKAALKLTEDETVTILMEYLKSDSWTIESYCLGQQRGYDIVATRANDRLYIEAKGAKASNQSPTKRRSYFDSGQIKDHFGKAIVKSLETKIEHPNALVAIAHPDDQDIRRTIGGTIPLIGKLGIMHFWVNKESTQLVVNPDPK